VRSRNSSTLTMAYFQVSCFWRLPTTDETAAAPIFRRVLVDGPVEVSAGARLIVKAVEAANAKLAESGIEPIERLSPHGLRQSYASLRSACGYSLASTTKQIGHTDVRFTQNVYTHAPEHAELLEGVALEQYTRRSNGQEWAVARMRALVSRLNCKQKTRVSSAFV
jgi:hypothetical protein